MYKPETMNGNTCGVKFIGFLSEDVSFNHSIHLT